MAEKKSKKIFEEDLTVFHAENIKSLKAQEADVRTPAPKAKKRNPRTQTSKDLSQLIQNLQALGFKITPPSSAEDVQRHEESFEKLGLVDAKKKTVKSPPESSTIAFVLGAQHVIAGQVFGPGDVVLPADQSDLARTLMHQDQLCMSAHMDSAQYQPFSRCFLIKPGSGKDQFNKFRKQEVTAAQLVSATDNDQDFSAVAVTAGAMDIAGYNPNFIMENKSF